MAPPTEADLFHAWLRHIHLACMFPRFERHQVASLHHLDKMDDKFLEALGVASKAQRYLFLRYRAEKLAEERRPREARD